MLADAPLLLDAAHGTRLIARGLDLRHDDPALWNLAHPEVVAELHRLDVAAGADAVLTNTFGANRSWFGRFGRGELVARVNRAAVALARGAAGPGRFVIGCLGPSAVREPEAYREQAVLLAEAGVDALILETHTFDEALHLGLPTLRGLDLPPILVGLRDADVIDGGEVRRLVDLGARAVGGNCLPGMGPVQRMAERWAGTLDVPLIAEPGAGLPGDEPASPESFAEAVSTLLARGVAFFGGCCGTTEAHVAALRAGLAACGVRGMMDRAAPRP